MMRVVLLIFSVVSVLFASAQNPFKDNLKWNEYFSSLTSFNIAVYTLTGKELNQQYARGNYYDILLVFPDGTWSEEKVVFTGIVDFCDSTKPLNIKQHDRDAVSPLPKSKFAYFVFDNKYTFKFMYPGNRASRTARWGIVYL